MVGKTLHEAVEEKNIAVIRRLINQGVDLNAKNCDGNTPLHLACSSGKLGIVKILLDARADVNVKNHEDNTALAVTLFELEKEFKKPQSKQNFLNTVARVLSLRRVIMLLIQVVDVNAKMDDSCTPLHKAVLTNYEILMKFINAGAKASVNEKNSTGYTPLQIAVRYRKQVQFNYKLKSSQSNGGKSSDYVFSSPSLENKKIYNLLIRSGADVNIKDNTGQTVLYHPLRFKYFDMAEMLIDFGADLDCKDNEGFTPFHLAATLNNIPTIKYLLTSGASIDEKSNSDMTPLHLAVVKNKQDSHFKTIKILLDHGADVNVPNENGQTPFDVVKTDGKKKKNIKTLDLIHQHVNKKVPTSENVETYKMSTVETIENIKDIKFDKKIGQGSFGTVFRGRWLKTPVAIKTINYIDNPKSIREFSILSQLSHDNIIRLSAICFDESQLHIIMEFFKGCSLKEAIFHPRTVQFNCKLNEQLRNKIALQVCRGIYYLHHKKIIHRDIKPENILLNSKFQVKVCDFGLSKAINLASELMTTRGRIRACGTQSYMAPEIILNNEEATIHSDIWSMGCTLTELYTGKRTWEKVQNMGIKNILRRNYVPELSKVPDYLRTMLSSCFNYTANKRPSAGVMIDCIKHEVTTEQYKTIIDKTRNKKVLK